MSARRPGPRPLGCGSAPTAGGGGALLGAGSPRRGSPRARGGEAGEQGGGGEGGSGRRGERGREGAQTRRGRKGGRGRSRRGRKARSPPPAAACALRHHVRRGRQRVLRRSRPCFLCAPPGDRGRSLAGARPRRRAPSPPLRRARSRLGSPRRALPRVARCPAHRVPSGAPESPLVPRSLSKPL